MSFCWREMIGNWDLGHYLESFFFLLKFYITVLMFFHLLKEIMEKMMNVGDLTSKITRLFMFLYSSGFMLVEAL